MKSLKKVRSLFINCQVNTKPQPHPFRTALDLKLKEKIPDNIKEILKQHYQKNMVPIIKACGTDKLKEEIQHYVDTATFENIKITDVVSETFEIQ